jgi:SAM-dependent methyltransferase
MIPLRDQKRVRDSRLYLSGWFRHRILRQYLSLAGNPNGILLDVGGGSGNISYHFQNDFNSVIVVDISLNSLYQLEQSLFEPVQADALALPVRDESVDRIISVDFQEHLPANQVLSMLKELHRVLKPGGICAVFTSCYGFSLRRLIYRLRGLPQRGRLDWSDWAQDGHLNRLTPREHFLTTEAAGFQIKGHCYYGHFFDPLCRRFHQLMVRLYASLNGTGKKNSEQLARKYRGGSRSFWVEFYFQTLILFAYLDKILLGRFPGSSIFMMLCKPFR